MPYEKNKTRTNLEWSSPKMLMDCIQFPLVMRRVHSHMQWDRWIRPQLREIEMFSAARPAHWNSRREPSSSSTLLERMSPSADKQWSSPPVWPQVTLFRNLLSPLWSTTRTRPYIHFANDAIWEMCAWEDLVTKEALHAQKRVPPKFCCQEH